MTWEEFLNERPLAVVSTVGADGMPHAVPVEVVVDGGRAYSWGHAESARLRNLRANPKIALVAYKGQQSFVMVRGVARILTQADDEYARITQLFLKKYDREETYGNDTLTEIAPEQIVQR